MSPLAPKPNPGKSEKRLLSLFKSLPEAEQRTLLQFAEFLSERAEPVPVAIPVPEPIARPEEESVVKAMKRLSATYHMVEKSKLLSETSALMAQHIMQGRPAVEVIDELEIVFEAHYKRLLDDTE